MSNNETLIDINNTENTEQQNLENYLIKLINWKYLFIFYSKQIIYILIVFF